MPTSSVAGRAAGAGARNPVTGRRRIPWSDLSDKDRKRKYDQAIRAHNVGLPVPHPETFAKYSKRQRALDLLNEPEPKSPSRRKSSALPALFGSSARTQILLALHANGPMTVREVARLRKTDSATTFRSVERLIACGLIVKRDRPGGRRYIAIDKSHFAAKELGALLDTLNLHFAIPNIEQARIRRGLPTDRDPKPPILELSMFGSSIRSRIMLMLAVAGEADEQQLARSLAVAHTLIWSALRTIANAKLLSEKRVGARRVVSLSTRYPAAEEFIVFLKAVARGKPVYKSKALTIHLLTRRWR